MNGITQEIKHVVVLMFENRSFDHLFGAFPGVNGIFAENGQVKPEIYNLADPTSPPGPSNQTYLPVAITPDVKLLHDFDHNFGNGMMQELFGPGTTGWQNGRPINAPAVTYPPTNSGFVSTIAYNVNVGTRQGPQAMSYFQYGSLWVLHSLASEFVLCDNWFCDTPGDTLLNRFFMHTAQTDGYLSDDQSKILGVKTIFDQITERGFSWKMYAPNQHIDSSFLETIRYSKFTNQPITEFAADAAAGTLPFYSFLMCWSQGMDTSMHPPSDIRPGENYLAAVYNTLRQSPSWNDTLLIVTFDENGGMYDHVAPPVTTAPNAKRGREWDSYLNAWCTFDFTLLGPRIPAILISPWLRSGIAKTQYQNTSILQFLQSFIGAPGLTARDATAPGLDSLFAEFGLSQPRTDCPASIAGYPGFPYADGDLSKTQVVPPAPRSCHRPTRRIWPRFTATVEMRGNLLRRTFIKSAAAVVAAAAFPQRASAEDYPARPVRIVAGFAAGGGVDVTARLIGQWLAERLGQSFVIENRPGAGGNIGTEAVVNAAPDGYTLLLATVPNAVNASLYEKLNFNFIRDTAPVAGIIRVPMVILLNPSVPARTVAEFISYAKTNPEKVNMASAGNGSAPHMAGELFKMMAGVNLVHVPYRGQGPALSDLLGGQVQVLFAATPGTTDYITTGRLRALAVTSASRAEMLPELATVGDFVPGYEASQWYGISAPKNTPAEIVGKLNKEINAAIADPKMKARLAAIGGEPLPGSPAEFGRLIAEETAKWGKVVRAAGIKPE